MTDQWTPEQDAAFLAAAREPSAIQSAPTAALDASRVDLIDLIRNGIPEPEYVPGGAPWLRKGKRYLIPAPAGTGKSLAGLIIAITTIEHGGSAIILDVENGADEYARRLESILTARDHDGSLTRACQERLSYHTWPVLRLDWTADEWAAAIAGADLVIFDSSRFMLSSVGLGEDSNDDYSQFITAIVLPLAKAGATTILLDNTGHGETRARGASTKNDLNEVVYELSVAQQFDDHTAGQLRLTRTRGRFSGLPDELRIHVGANTYTAPVESLGTALPRSKRPSINMERVSKLLERDPGLGSTEIRTALGGNAKSVDLAIALLISEGHISVPDQTPAGSKKPHRVIRPYRRADDPEDPERDPLSKPCPNPVQDRVEGDRDPLSPSLRTGGTDTVPQTRSTPNPVQDRPQ